MIEQHKHRSFIRNLRNDPRTRAMVDGWIAQAMVKVEIGASRDYDRRATHEAVREGIALALSFILDNDGEYQMVCEERDRLRDHILQGVTSLPIPRVLRPQ